MTPKQANELKAGDKVVSDGGIEYTVVVATLIVGTMRYARCLTDAGAVVLLPIGVLSKLDPTAE